MTATDGVSTCDGTTGTPESPVLSAKQFVTQAYDFVIVGGGTAGLTIAARLTEDPDISVGVIEAGKNRLGDTLVDTPALCTQMLGNPEYDWMMFTNPQVWRLLD